MRLSSAQLRAFFEVARTGGFSKAAETLHLTQSALSQRIQNLEEELAVTLFLRERQGARLTGAGERLLRYCRVHEVMEDEMLQELRGTDKAGRVSGEIRIGAFSSVLRSVILPSLADLMAEHTDLRIEAVNRELRDLPALLRSGEADYVVVQKDINRAGLCAVPLGWEENVLVAARNRSIREDVYLDHDAEDTTTEQFLELQGQKAPLQRRSFLDEIYAILDGVAMGWGRAVVPRHLAAQREDLVVVPGLKPLRLPVTLHFTEQTVYPRFHRLVVEALVTRAPALLAK